MTNPHLLQRSRRAPFATLSRLLRGLAALGLLLATSCVHQVIPTVSPSEIPPVSPPIQSRALLLISPSFEEYLSESSNELEQYRFHYGTAATAALSQLVARSFVANEVRRLSDADVLSTLAGPIDTAITDMLLVPAFERAGARERLLDIVAEVRLRLTIRSSRTGAILTLATQGRTTRVVSSTGGLTGSALEQALHALSDSLRAHRAELEAHSPAP
jgi:hypothetical protein